MNFSELNFAPQQQEHGKEAGQWVCDVAEDHGQVEGHGAIRQAGEALHRRQHPVGERVGDGEQQEQVDVDPRPKGRRGRLLLLRGPLLLAVLQRVRFLFPLFARRSVGLLLGLVLLVGPRLPLRQSPETQGRDEQHDAQEPKEVLHGEFLLQILGLNSAGVVFTLQFAHALSESHDAGEESAEALADEESPDVLRGETKHERQEGHVGRAADKGQHEGEEQEHQ